MGIGSESVINNLEFLLIYFVIIYYHRILVQNCGIGYINNLEFSLIYFMDICDSSVLPMQFNFIINVLATSEE